MSSNQLFDEMCQLFGKDSVDEITFRDLNVIKNNFYIQQIYDKQNIINQLNDGINQIIDMIQICCNNPSIYYYDPIQQNITTPYKSFKDWYNYFTHKLEDFFKANKKVQSNEFKYSLNFIDACNFLICDNDFSLYGKNNNSTIFAKVSYKLYETLINSQELESIFSNKNRLLPIYIEEHSDIIARAIPLIILCLCSNEESIKILNLITSNLEKYIIDVLNNEDEISAIARDEESQGGIYNWNNIWLPSEYNFGWIKKQQVIEKDYDESTLLSKTTPFNIIFKNVDRKHMLEVSGEVKVKSTNGNYKASIKLDSAIIHELKPENKIININTFKHEQTLKSNIIEKLKEYFIKVAKEL